MAKKNATDELKTLPTVKADEPEEKKPALPSATIDIPIGTMREDAYRLRHVDVQFTDRQSRAMRRLFDSLDATGERLENKKRVCSGADALRWLLERVAAAYDVR
ncbi:MAG TPA: hypothetical protein VGG64_12710 [Pirellulales bacterium]|jgi:hypothetical protein